MAITKVAASANGTASHTPGMPRNQGKTISPAVIKPNVLKKDSNAEVLPFERAVKTAEVKILNPHNKKLKEKMENPSNAIL